MQAVGIAVFGCSQYLLLQGTAVLQGAASVLRGRLKLLGQPAQMRINGRGAGVAQQARSNAFGVIRTRGERLRGDVHDMAPDGIGGRA